MSPLDGRSYPSGTGSELEVVVHGAASDLPADRVLFQLRSLIEVMGLLEDTAVRRDRAPRQRSTWSFGELGLGSVHARLQPLARAADTTVAHLDRVPLSVVEGFHHAEQSTDLPSGWSEQLAGAGRRVAENLGATADRGMTLTLLEDGRPVRQVDVTSRAAMNLQVAVDVKRKSLGSTIGVLASVNTRRLQVGLWSEPDDRRVAASISRDQIDVVRENLDRRVLIGGELTRNGADQVLSLRADEITSWPRSRRRLSESGGVARGFLGEESPVDHLERVGGWAT